MVVLFSCAVPTGVSRRRVDAMTTTTTRYDDAIRR